MRSFLKEDDLGWGPIFMDIILPSAIGLAVACAVFVLGRVFVGSGSTPDKLSTFAGAKIVDEAKAARAVSLSRSWTMIANQTARYDEMMEIIEGAAQR